MAFVKRYFYILFIPIIILTGASCASAVDDGAAFDKKAEGKYVTVYYYSSADILHLEQLLNIRPSDKIIAGESLHAKKSEEEKLAQMLDTLFLQVSDILEMHLYSLNTSVKICRNNSELNGIYEHLFNSSLGGRSSFYVYDVNSIYVSEEEFKKGIIGHEMAHAVICHYFVVPPPVKIQEVLAMYVEYSLRHEGAQ